VRCSYSLGVWSKESRCAPVMQRLALVDLQGNTMSTLAELKTLGALMTWPLEGDGLCERTLYYTAEWSQFVGKLPDPERPPFAQNAKLSERESVKQMCSAFCAGKAMDWLEYYGKIPAFQQARTGQSVWEMSTKHTRSFGWFPGQNVFVAICGWPLSAFKDKRGKSIDAVYQAMTKEVEDWRFNQAIQAFEISSLTDVQSLVLPCKA
jgi:hypothetical protein